MKQTHPIRNIQLFYFWHRGTGSIRKGCPFSQWLKCEIPQLMATSRLQLQVGVAAEPQRHACQLNYSFLCNMALMCAFKIVCMSPYNWPRHFPSLSCTEIWSPVGWCKTTLKADRCRTSKVVQPDVKLVVEFGVFGSLSAAFSLRLVRRWMS